MKLRKLKIQKKVEEKRNGEINDKYNSQQFSTLRSFAVNIFNRKVALDNAHENQAALLILIEIMNYII